MAAAWILWAGTVGLDTALEQRVAAAHAAGCSHISVGFNDVRAAQEQGLDAATLGRQLRDRGLGLVLDGITTWAPGSTLPKRNLVTAEEGMAIAAQLGARSINAVAIGRGPWSLPAMAERFAALCDEAMAFGASVHIEFAPESGVPNLTAAWELVERADRPNGGVLFDTWHFYRSHSDFELLRKIPADRMLAIQVSDAPVEITGSMWEDTLHHRLLPGDGAIDLTALFTALGPDALALVGPEVFNDDLMSQPLDEVASTACARTREVITAALGPGWEQPCS